MNKFILKYGSVVGRDDSDDEIVGIFWNGDKKSLDKHILLQIKSFNPPGFLDEIIINNQSFSVFDIGVNDVDGKLISKYKLFELDEWFNEISQKNIFYN